MARRAPLGPLLLALLCAPRVLRAEERGSFVGRALPEVVVRGAGLPKEGSLEAVSDLSQKLRPPGTYELSFYFLAGPDETRLRIPLCTGRSDVRLDGHPVLPTDRLPVDADIAEGPHVVSFRVKVSAYERRITCSQSARVGSLTGGAGGFRMLRFESPHKGGGEALAYVPEGHDTSRPLPLLVGLHPWDATLYTYAAYYELIDEAERRGIVLLFPSGLGNSLYTERAEDEVLRAITAWSKVVPPDPRAISLWGASMGGAGATTIAFHNPSRFASAVSYFGDSKYDVSTYVKSILPGDKQAHLVNALDIVDNAAHLPVLLIHGEQDRVSPIEQSTMLYEAMRKRGYSVRLIREPKAGHDGWLIGKHLRDAVAFATTARVPLAPQRVQYTSVREGLDGAYGVRMVRASREGDSTIDLERQGNTIVVRRAERVRSLELLPGAFGFDGDARPEIKWPNGSVVPVTWGNKAR